MKRLSGAVRLSKFNSITILLFCLRDDFSGVLGPTEAQSLLCLNPALLTHAHNLRSQQTLHPSSKGIQCTPMHPKLQANKVEPTVGSWLTTHLIPTVLLQTMKEAAGVG